MTRRRRVRSMLAVCVALGVGGVLTGCGGGDVEPRAWTADVCGSAQEYQKAVQKAASKFRPDPTDPAKTKESFTDLLASIERAVGALEADVENAGVPATENGEAAKNRIIDGLQASEQTFAQARKDVEAASATDMNALSKVFGEVSKDIQESQAKFGKIQERLGSAELKKAFEQAPACKELRGG